MIHYTRRQLQLYYRWSAKLEDAAHADRIEEMRIAMSSVDIRDLLKGLRHGE